MNNEIGIPINVFGLKEKIDALNEAIDFLRKAEKAVERANRICAYVDLAVSEPSPES